MNVLHEILDMVLPFNFADPDVRRVALRAIPFSAAAFFFFLGLVTILVRSIRGQKDGYVISEIVTKGALIVYLVALSLNYWEIWRGNELFFDINRVWLGGGALIGLPLVARYLFFAVQDEWRYWRNRWKEKRQHHDIDRDVTGFP